MTTSQHQPDKIEVTINRKKTTIGGGRSMTIVHNETPHGLHTKLVVNGNWEPTEFLERLRIIEHAVGHEILDACSVKDLLVRVGFDVVVDAMIEDILNNPHQPES